MAQIPYCVVLPFIHDDGELVAEQANSVQAPCCVARPAMTGRKTGAIAVSRTRDPSLVTLTRR